VPELLRRWPDEGGSQRAGPGRRRRRRHARARQVGPDRTAVDSSAGDSTGAIGRITITIRAGALPPTPAAAAAQAGACPLPLRPIAATILAAARKAAARARAQAETDTRAGGCAHTTASASYRPPPRIREHIAARDKTCRHPTCGQPAWRTDLDHTIPWHRGGHICPCNLDGCCRTHHLIKHLPGWHLDQTSPGYFTWTTPAGRSYLVHPTNTPYRRLAAGLVMPSALAGSSEMNGAHRAVRGTEPSALRCPLGCRTRRALLRLCTGLPDCSWPALLAAARRYWGAHPIRALRLVSASARIR